VSSAVDAAVGLGSLKFPNWRRVLVWRVAGTSIVVGEVQGHLLDGVVSGNGTRCGISLDTVTGSASIRYS